MKKIDVTYNTDGYIENITDNAVHFEQENDSLMINATIQTDKKVRAYIKSPNNNSTVTDELTPVDGVYSCVVDGDYMAKGTLYIGFEMYDDEGYVERLEPLKIYIDSFVKLGGGSSDNVYVVTVKVGTVQTLATGEPATVENAGTKKDMVLNFGLPRGDKGVKGDKGDKGDKGEKGDKGDKGDTGPQGEKGEQGIQGIQGVPGKDGYTPVKGVDYFTEEDIEGLGIDSKADMEYVANVYTDLEAQIMDRVEKVNGKGLSTNDFTNVLKAKVENNTFDYYIEPTEYEENFDYDSYTGQGIYLLHKDNVSDDEIRPYYILTVTYYYDYGCGYESGNIPRVTVQTRLNLINGETERRDDSSGRWSAWQKVSVSQTDLDKAIGDIEASLENIIAKYGLGGDVV